MNDILFQLPERIIRFDLERNNIAGLKFRSDSKKNHALTGGDFYPIQLHSLSALPFTEHQNKYSANG